MGGDDGLLSLEENLRGLLEEETLKEASVRHLFRLFDEQIWVFFFFFFFFFLFFLFLFLPLVHSNSSQKLNESAYVSCESEEEQKAVLALLKTHKEERKRFDFCQRFQSDFFLTSSNIPRLKDSFREAQIREGERKSRARQNLLGRDEGKTDNQEFVFFLCFSLSCYSFLILILITFSSQKGLRAERANVQKKTESLQSMIRLLRREMNQGASAFDRLGWYFFWGDRGCDWGLMI